MGDQDAAKVSRAVKSGTVVALLFTSVFVATLFTKSADAQNGCDNGDNGVIRLPNNINGQITICPAIGRQVPAMERQLNQILALEKSESASTADFTRLLKGLNNVSHNIGRDRQTELLKSLVAQLSASQKESDDALAVEAQQVVPIQACS